jgi:hypothetical protein
VAVDDLEEALNDSMAGLEEVAGQAKPPEAWRDLGDTTLERFWQTWPQVRAWGQWLWTLIDNERGDKATPVAPDTEEEIGGGG